MNAVYYNKSTGRIICTVRATAEHVEASAGENGWLEVDEWRADWDATHKVQDGRLVDRDAADIASDREALAWIELRVQRDARLAYEVDPIICNPIRWEALSGAAQDALKAYRKALLDLPANTANPFDVNWPVFPSAK